MDEGREVAAANSVGTKVCSSHLGLLSFTILGWKVPPIEVQIVLSPVLSSY